MVGAGGTEREPTIDLTRAGRPRPEEKSGEEGRRGWIGRTRSRTTGPGGLAPGVEGRGAPRRPASLRLEGERRRMRARLGKTGWQGVVVRPAQGRGKERHGSGGGKGAEARAAELYCVPDSSVAEETTASYTWGAGGSGRGVRCGPRLC
jgi:hypothetical protein